MRNSVLCIETKVMYTKFEYEIFQNISLIKFIKKREKCNLITQ